MKYIFRINFNVSSDWLNNEIFGNEKLRERENVPDTTGLTRCILDTHYEKTDVSKFAS